MERLIKIYIVDTTKELDQFPNIKISITSFYQCFSNESKY